MTSTNELLPCPFCGGEAKISHVRDICRDPQDWYWGKCSSCNISGNHYPTEAEAIAAWNTRADPGSGTCKNVAREWEKTSFAHAGTSFCCSECGAHYVDVECYYAGLADKDEEQIRTNFCPNCGREVVNGC